MTAKHAGESRIADQPEQRCACRHLFSAHGPSGCHAIMTITPVAPDETGRVECGCDRWPPVDAGAPARCADPNCDGEFGHDGPHFAWTPE